MPERDSSADVIGASKEGTRFERADAFIIAVLLLWALALYRPWVDLPQPVADMPEILSTLQRAPNVLDGTRGLIAHYAREGRFMPGSMATLTVFHRLFGEEGADWRWGRFLLCALVTASAYVVYRRLRLGRLGAAAGASLFVIANPALPGWLMPQVMEPAALVFLFSALALALRYRSTARPWPTALAIGLLLVAAIWVKEPMIAAVPFVLLVALVWNDGEWSLTPRDGRMVILVLAVGALVLILNVLPLAYVRLANDSPNYASRYSVGGLSWGSWSNAFRASILPVTRVLWFPANLAAVGLVVLGIRAAGRQRRRTHLALLGVAALLPIAVSLIYAPWPSFPGYYALPALMGLGVIIAASVYRANLLQPSLRLLALGLAVLVVGLGSLMASNAFQRYRAERLLEAAVARAIAESTDSVSLVLGTRDTSVSGVFGRGLVRYTRLFAGSTAIKDAADIPCERAQLSVQSVPGDTIVVAFLDDCPLAHRPDQVIRARFTQWQWRTLRRGPDSVGAAIVRPHRRPGA